MSNSALASHGTLIKWQRGGSGSFVTIGELRDITPPALQRNAIETSSQSDEEDAYVVGMKRRGELQFQIGYIPDAATHDQTTGLVKSWNDGSLDGFKVVYPDASEWIFSGYITNFAPAAPNDDGLVADVTVRPSGAMSFV